MSRLLLQAAAAAANSTAAHSSGSGPGKSGVIYTFTFIGATLLIGLTFMGFMFRYVVKNGYFRAPVTAPLQRAAAKPEDDYVSDLPNIKEIVVISNPDGCASVCIVREDAVTDGRPPFITYETTVSKKAFENFSQKYLAHSHVGSTRSMTHAASASDLASMNQLSVTNPSNARQQALPEKAVAEDHQNA